LEISKNRLQNFNPQIVIVSARKRGAHFGMEDQDILGPLISANMIFMRSGYPTYAVR